MTPACYSPDCPEAGEIYLLVGWRPDGQLYEHTYCLSHAIDYLNGALSELKIRRWRRSRQQEGFLDDLSTPAPWSDAS